MRPTLTPSRPTRLLLALLLLTAGCQWGTRPKNFGPAQGPEGAAVTFRLVNEKQSRNGELYAVDSAGLFLLAPRLIHVAWTRIEWADVQKMGDAYDVFPRQEISAAKRARLALVSRFPQGLTDDLLARVLGMLSQSAVEEIR